MLRATWIARRGSPHLESDVAVQYASSTVTLVADTFYIDYCTLYGLVVDRQFLSDFEGAVVIDIGAHKGYYGAMALALGAARVVSFEPASQNFRYLERASASLYPGTQTWRTNQSAVGTADGVATLSLSGSSWGHSLLAPVGGEVIGTECVEVVSLASVLEEAAGDARGLPVIVKINIEGMAGSLVVGTPVDLWCRVREVWLDVESNDPVPEQEFVQHLQAAGLLLRKRAGRTWFFQQRAESHAR